MAAEVCDLPGQGYGKAGFHHTLADGEVEGINEWGVFRALRSRCSVISATETRSDSTNSDALS